MFYLINPLQQYDYGSTKYFELENSEIDSNRKLEIIIQNMDNALLILDNIEINGNTYYPTKGTLINKNTIASLCVYIDECVKLNATTIIMTIKDPIGNTHKYKLGYRSPES